MLQRNSTTSPNTEASRYPARMGIELRYGSRASTVELAADTPELTEELLVVLFFTLDQVRQMAEASA